MKDNLVVILGAGASYDCVYPGTTRNPDLIPPLVSELFSNRGSFCKFKKTTRLFPVQPQK